MSAICQAIKKCGDCCTNRKKYGDFCGVHQAKHECPVCYETKGCEKLNCGHSVCHSCSKEWFSKKTTCPMCRAVVKRATNWWGGHPARRNNPINMLLSDMEELEAFAVAFATARVAYDSAQEEDNRGLTPRSLVDYFDLVA